LDEKFSYLWFLVLANSMPIYKPAAEKERVIYPADIAGITENMG
jgi:hypothetical protein